MKVSEGTRTPDRLDHNQELYQLSYAHRGRLNLPSPAVRGPDQRDDWRAHGMSLPAGAGFERARQVTCMPISGIPLGPT